MKKFKPIKKIDSKSVYTDFYSIEEINGVKHIHIFGCLWADDGRIFCEEYVGFVEPLADFISHLNEDAYYVGNKIATLTQYSENMEETDAIECINTYFDGKGADYILDYTDITTDTPIGNYMNYYL